jgi:hypothetical protein
LDRSLFDFAAVRATGQPEPDGDIAFDVDAALERATETLGTGAADIRLLVRTD